MSQFPTPSQGVRYSFVAQSITNHPPIYHHHLPTDLIAGAAIDPSTGQLYEIGALLAGSEGDAWRTSTANEIGRLAQGVGTCMPHGTDTIFFIDLTSKPKN